MKLITIVVKVRNILIPAWCLLVAKVKRGKAFSPKK
jgi:hypothetical protein